jgi:hypothetical protein
VVPPEYSIFFTTMATVGATLFGLIFVAISITPEEISSESVSADRQIRAIAAYIALLNPLMISLFAIVPYQLLGIAVLSLSIVGILNTLTMVATMLTGAERGNVKARNLLLIFASLILYSLEGFVAIQLERPIIKTYWFSILADLLIFISLFGIVRAWELIGIRQLHIRDWLSRIMFTKTNVAIGGLKEVNSLHGKQGKEGKEDTEGKEGNIEPR